MKYGDKVKDKKGNIYTVISKWFRMGCEVASLQPERGISLVTLCLYDLELV